MKSSRQVLDIRRAQTNTRYLPFGVKAGFIIFAVSHSISGLAQPSAVPPPPNPTPTSTASAKPPLLESWLTYRYADYHGVDYDFDGVNYKWTWDTRKTEFGAQSEFVRFMDLAMDTAGVHANNPDAPARARSEAMQLYLQMTETNNLKRHWGCIVDFYSH